MPIQLEAESLEAHRSPLASMRCEECGYGVSRSTAPDRCPMCGGTEWEHDRWRPFSELVRDLAPEHRRRLQ
jgi:hypothetical protein